MILNLTIIIIIILWICKVFCEDNLEYSWNDDVGTQYFQHFTMDFAIFVLIGCRTLSINRELMFYLICNNFNF